MKLIEILRLCYDCNITIDDQNWIPLYDGSIAKYWNSKQRPIDFEHCEIEDITTYEGNYIGIRIVR